MALDEGITLTRASASPTSDYLPEQRLCAMPEQTLWPRPVEELRPTLNVKLVRVLLLFCSIAATAAFSFTLFGVLSVQVPTPLQIVFLIISTVCFAWVVVGSLSAVFGFLALVAHQSIDTVEVPPATAGARLSTRTALLFPVYQEDAFAVAATIETMWLEIERAGFIQNIDVFILSDTQNDEKRAIERAVHTKLLDRIGETANVFIRWRRPNTGKKAGNIREWIERFGGGYEHFVILDADSIMSASTLSRLIVAMQNNQRSALIQTVPRLVGGHSMFARLQQFAAGYYGPVITAGLSTWYGNTGNYWGHNAIVRTQAFATSAGLPQLPGKPPFGGHILSHDFVEAALLRRAGWGVHFVPSLGGSFEGSPPALDELIVRDRRWAQGNLQHLGILSARKLRLLSRVHLAMGAFAYLASAVWAATLLVGVVLAFQAKYARPSYFGSQESLFPQWPVFDAAKALTLFWITIAVVYLPKLLGALWASRNSSQRKLNGGALRVFCGVIYESIFSTLIAPVLMLTQSNAVIEIFLGRDSGWGSQRRGGAEARLIDCFVRHRWHLLIGVALTTVCGLISLSVLAWMSPIALGLLLSAFVAYGTSRSGGQAARVLLATPEDWHLDPLLRLHAEKRRQWQSLK